MSKLLKSVLLIGLVLLSGTLLVACGDKGESKAMKAAKEELTVEKILKDNTSKDEVKTDLELIATVGDATVTWSSDKVSVINVAGKVTRGSNDETVKLTANLKIGEETANKEFSVKVLKVENGTNPDPTPNPNPEPGSGSKVTETFDNAEIGTTYSDGSFVGVDGITWTYIHSRDEGDHAIDTKGIMLRGENKGIVSSIEATFADGLNNFGFEYRKAFTGGAERTYAVDIIVGGSVIKTYNFGFTTAAKTEEETIYTFDLSKQEGFSSLNLSGNVTIKIYALGEGNKQMTIDNISWIKK